MKSKAKRRMQNREVCACPIKGLAIGIIMIIFKLSSPVLFSFSFLTSSGNDYQDRSLLLALPSSIYLVMLGMHPLLLATLCVYTTAIYFFFLLLPLPLLT